MRINEEKVIERLYEVDMIPDNAIITKEENEPWHCEIYDIYEVHIVTIGAPLKPTSLYWIKERIVKEFGHCNELLIFLFMLFHEIGHYYAWMEGVENDPLQDHLLDTLLEIACNDNQVLDVEKRYRKLAAEAFCDDFAIEQIKNLFKKERRDICENQ